MLCQEKYYNLKTGPMTMITKKINIIEFGFEKLVDWQGNRRISDENLVPD